jgi:hypothetical protein
MNNPSLTLLLLAFSQADQAHWKAHKANWKAHQGKAKPKKTKLLKAQAVTNACAFALYCLIQDNQIDVSKLRQEDQERIERIITKAQSWWDTEKEGNI